MGITFREQLNGSPNEGANCAPLACAHGADFMSNGAVMLNAEQMRARMVPPAKPDKGTNTAQQEAALRSLAPLFKREGLEPPDVTRHLDDPKKWVTTALENGHAVILSIDYGHLNDHSPRLSGDRRFRSGHSILLVGRRVVGGEVRTRVFDGLHDGRRKDVPQGPLWASLRAYLDAADAFAPGPNDATGLVVRRSAPLPVQPKPEPKPETPAQTIRRLKAALAQAESSARAAAAEAADAKEDAATARADLREARARLQKTREALALARNALLSVGNDAEAALDAIAEVMSPTAEPGAGATVGIE